MAIPFFETLERIRYPTCTKTIDVNSASPYHESNGFRRTAGWLMKHLLSHRRRKRSHNTHVAMRSDFSPIRYIGNGNSKHKKSGTSRIEKGSPTNKTPTAIGSSPNRLRRSKMPPPTRRSPRAVMLMTGISVPRNVTEIGEHYPGDDTFKYFMGR
jgi:hypothetical protein